MIVPHPTKLKVGPFTYLVTSSQAAIDAACRTEGADLFGHTDFATLRIAIAPDTHPARQQETLLHEVLHTLTRQAGIVNELSATDEERLVTRLAPILLDTLRRNPTLVAYLTA